MKRTRKLLISSFIMIISCCLLFAGTTFAWFSDSVSSNNNVITAGNLDIEVEYTLDGEKWANLAGAEDLFQKSLWEPGHTELVVLKVKNVGSLALKFEAQLNIAEEVIGINKAGEDIVLSEILMLSALSFADAGIDPLFGFNIAEKTIEEAFKGEDDIAYLDPVAFGQVNKLADEERLMPGEVHYLAIKVDMPSTVGNEANHNGVDVPSIAFGINVFAAQLNSEEDSFGNNYDKDAEYDNPSDYGYEVVYIYNLEDFTKFGNAVNGNTTYGGVKVANNNKVWVEVMDDIDMTNAPAIQGTEFAIGNGNNLQFTGIFDGNNHTISNYTISASWTYNVSLFRTVSGAFTMKDVTFYNCSASKPNNKTSSLLVGTIGGGTIIFDNVDIKNSTISGVASASAYVGKMTEGALYFYDCDVENVTLTITSESGHNGMFLGEGYSHHDYEESGVWVENCTINNSKSIVAGSQDAVIKEYNYIK